MRRLQPEQSRDSSYTPTTIPIRRVQRLSSPGEKFVSNVVDLAAAAKDHIGERAGAADQKRALASHARDA